MRPGASAAQAQRELTQRRLAEQFPDRYPATRRFSFSVTPLLDKWWRHSPIALVLLAAVSCVLLIACANVANLC